VINANLDEVHGHTSPKVGTKVIKKGQLTSLFYDFYEFSFLKRVNIGQRFTYRVHFCIGKSLLRLSFLEKNVKSLQE